MKKLVVLLSIICMVGAVANANIVSNWGFESGTGTVATSWIQNALDGSTVQRVSETPYAGTFCMKGVINNTTGAPGKAEILQQTAVGSITSGVAYDFSFYAKGTVGPGCVAWYQIQWLDGDGSNGGGVKGITPLSGFWTTLNSTYQKFSQLGQTAPAGADCAYLSIRIEGGAFVGSNGTMYVDNVSITPEPMTLALLGLGGLLLRRRK
jgi:hypothetical protein